MVVICAEQMLAFELNKKTMRTSLRGPRSSTQVVQCNSSPARHEAEAAKGSKVLECFAASQDIGVDRPREQGYACSIRQLSANLFIAHICYIASSSQSPTSRNRSI